MIVPSEKMMEKAYAYLIKATLQSDTPISSTKLVQIAQWVRFDPRLGELWLQAFKKLWKSFSPILIRTLNLKQATPAVLGVLLEQFEVLYLSRLERKIFRLWKELVLAGVSPVNGEGFFIGVQPFAGASKKEDAEKPLRFYQKWGFLGRDLLINKAALRQQALQRTFLEKTLRQRVLSELVKKNLRITVEDYLMACNHAISKRVAQKDLEAYSKLKAVGHTKGRFYVKKQEKR